MVLSSKTVSPDQQQALQALVDRYGTIDHAAEVLQVPREPFREACRSAGVRAVRLSGARTCIACLTEADTGVIVQGDVYLHLATLAAVGVPRVEAAAVVQGFVDLGEPQAYCLCEPCAHRMRVSPLPLEGPMPLLTLGSLTRSKQRQSSAAEQANEGAR